ncbi:tetratricopeptide repeat protein [Thermochromatium tepidum]|nr:tetratricopeptide repeat protein [Thermochromatium tepidum]
MSSRFTALFGSALMVVTLAACVSAPESSDPDHQAVEPVAPGRDIDHFVLVDCLLPGQIRQLGTGMTYLSPRRMVKSTKSDCAIRGGEFVLFDRSDYANALAALLPKARAGDPVAQTYVGEIYEKGLGLPAPDYTSAADWYRRAAEQNHAPAQINLGSLYERGLGVPTDKARALDLYRRASGLTEDRLIFESRLKAEREAFQREIEVRNRVAAALRAQLQQAKAATRSTQLPGDTAAPAAPKPKTPQLTPMTTPPQIDPTQLQRQAQSQALDAKSEAERIEKELHAIEQLKRNEGEASGKAAQLGKLELARREQRRSLLDTSFQLSQIQ